MINNMHRKSEQYLRTHKIIQDDEEIPQAFTDGAKYSAKPDLDFSFTAWRLVSLVCFMALALVILVDELYNSRNYISGILVLFVLTLLSLIVSLIVIKIMKSFQDNILAIPLEFTSTTNVGNESKRFEISAIVTALSYIIMLGSLFSALCFVETGYVLTIDLRPYFYLPLRFSYLFISILSAFPMCISYKKFTKIEDKSHHFMTRKKVYFTKDILKDPYDSIEIADLKEIKAITRISACGRSNNYSYYLQYISDKNQIFVEVEEKFIRIEHLEELFWQTVITHTQEKR